MKILVYTDANIEKTGFLIDYIRNINPELMQHLIVIDCTKEDTVRKWGGAQNDLTYVYFEEDTATGSAFNQVIKELEIDDDILVTDNYHVPLIGSYERMLEGFKDNENAFALGPVSNSFPWEQHVDWVDAQAAISWSDNDCAGEYEEVLTLYPEVIMLKRDVVELEDTFCNDAEDINCMIAEKCIREFIGHGRMYVCRTSGFWDVREGDFTYIGQPSIDFMEKQFGIRYLNFRGNNRILDIILECNIEREECIKVLEVGCDCGGTLFRIKKLFPNARIYGTDINGNALKFASEFANVKINNIEDHDLDFGVTDFDLIIFGDVLEHLRDPLSVLLYCKTILKPGGRVAASIPNLMNIGVMRYLLNGFFPYTEVGLLDKTHIHMFTYNEIIRMFVNDAGFTIEIMSMNGRFSEDEERLADELLKLGNAEKFMYQAFQYQVVAKI